MSPPRCLTAVALVGSLMLAFLPACRPGAVAPAPADLAAQVDAQGLDVASRGLLSAAYTQLIGMAGNVAAQTDDREMRERTLLFRIRTSEVIDQLERLEDPRTRFILTWILAAQGRQRYVGDGGRQLFGDYHAPFAEFFEQYEQRVRRVGRRFFPADQFEQAADDIEQIASELPGSTELFAETARRTAQQRSDVVRVLTLPLAPMTGLQGVANTADAIDRFGDQAGRVADIVRNLPERTRWHAELLLLEADSLRTAQTLRGSAEQLSEQARAIRGVAEALPGRVERWLAEARQTLTDTAPAWRDTLAQAESVSRQVNAALDRVAPVSRELEALSDRVAEAGRAWELALAQVNAMRAPDGEPADDDDADAGPGVAAYTELAQQTTKAAAELRGLLDRIDAAAAPGGALDSAGDRLHARGVALLNAALWRFAALIVLAFLLALAYHRLTRGPRGR